MGESAPSRRDEHGIEWFDVGHGVEISYFQTATHERAGVIEAHQRPDGMRCEGSAMFNGRGMAANNDGWDVLSEDPLTLAPSLLCKICGHHGFIQGGRWVPA